MKQRDVETESDLWGKRKWIFSGDTNVTRTRNSKRLDAKTSNSTQPMQPKTQQALTK